MSRRPNCEEVGITSHASKASAATATASHAARAIALQMLEKRGRGAVLVGVAQVDTAVKILLKPGD
jgi:hypothetical protein